MAQKQSTTIVTLSTFEVGLADILGGLCWRPGRWVLICRVVGSANRYWQALAYEDGSLKVEVVSNAYLEDDECHSAKSEEVVDNVGMGSSDALRTVRIGGEWKRPRAHQSKMLRNRRSEH